MSWERLKKFSYKSLQRNFEKNAPVMWHLVNAYSNPTVKEGQVAVVRRYRPQMLVSHGQCLDNAVERSLTQVFADEHHDGSARRTHVLQIESGKPICPCAWCMAVRV